MFRRIWQIFKLSMGYPADPAPWQIGEVIVTMRESRDCLVAAIATALEISYEEAHAAIGHADLPWFLESPLLSNPASAMRALKKLGVSPDDSITWEQLLAGTLPSKKVIVLVHDYASPLKAVLNQHWVVWGGVDPTALDHHLLYWGNSHEPKSVPVQEFKAFYKAGWPNCAILVN